MQLKRIKPIQTKLQTLHIKTNLDQDTLTQCDQKSTHKSVIIKRRNHSSVKQNKSIIQSSKNVEQIRQNKSQCSIHRAIQIQFTERDTDNQLDYSYIESDQKGSTLVWKSPLRRNIITVAFPYPKICEAVRECNNLMEIPKVNLRYKLSGQVPFKCLLLAFEEAGLEPTDGEKWNLFWGMLGKEKEMKRNQKTNHFPGCWSIGRKDNLWMSLSKMKRKFPKDYYFVANTYLLAYDYERFESVRQQADNKQLWIKKPVAAARGQGIKIVNKNSKLSKDKKCLVMDYISNPHLINNFKYDLRVYVLITSIDPLRVYVYKDGLVRFATSEYSLKQKDLKKKYVHLTNFSVNKLSPNYKNDELEQSSKWTHFTYRRILQSMGINDKEVFRSIYDVILKTCIASESLLQQQSYQKNNHFELYGFDILVDSNLKPWVLEVNVSPSLNSASTLDAKLKTKLVTDTFHLVGIPCSKLPREMPRQFDRNLNEIKNINANNFRDKVNPQDINVLITSLEEQMRLGNYKCLYPKKKTIENYDQYFTYQRFQNKLITKYFQDQCNWQF